MAITANENQYGFTQSLNLVFKKLRLIPNLHFEHNIAQHLWLFLLEPLNRHKVTVVYTSI